MAKKKDLTLVVHRAFIDDNFSETQKIYSLADLLGRLRSELGEGEHIADRSVLDKTAIKFPSFPKTNEAVATALALYSIGAEKSTISPEAEVNSYETSSISAPERSEFLDHQVLLLAFGDLVISCGLGKRNSLLVDVIGKFAKKCGIDLHPTALRFADTPNHLSVDRIKKSGVKYIKFDAANFLGSMDIPTDSLIGHYFGRTHSTKDYERQNLIAEVIIKPKSKRSGKLDFLETPKNEWLGQAAIKTHNEERVDSYTIVLNDDTEWRDGDLKLVRTVKVKQDGSTFSIPEALQKMLEYKNELEKLEHLV